MADTEKSEVVSLKDLLLIIIEYVKEVKKHYLWLLLFGVLFGVLFCFKAFKTYTKYTAQLTYMMDDGQSAGIPGLDLIGSFIGGGKESDNSAKLIHLVKSRQILHSALFKKVLYGDKEEFLINHIISEYASNYNVENPGVLDLFFNRAVWIYSLEDSIEFRFTNSQVEEFSQKELQILNIIYTTLVSKNGAVTPNVRAYIEEDGSGILTLASVSESEGLSIIITNTVYDELSSYFVDKTIEKQQKTHEVISAKKDSIYELLLTKEQMLMSQKDRSRGLIGNTSQLPKLKLQREVLVLNTMYGEVVKQFEATDFTLRNKKPILQTIDSPLKPLSRKESKWYKGLFMGVFFGVFLMMTFVVLRKFWRTILSS